MSQPAASRSMFAVFRKRDFSLMWSAQLVSTIGSSLTDLAAGILIFRLTGSAFAVGLTLMVTAIPTLLVGLVAGVFVDRFDRKRILLASDLLRGLHRRVHPVRGGEQFGIVALYALLFLSATVRQFFDPAWESVLPEIATRRGARGGELVPVDQLVRLDRGRLRRGRASSLGPTSSCPFYIDGADVPRSRCPGARRADPKMQARPSRRRSASSSTT